MDNEAALAGNIIKALVVSVIVVIVVAVVIFLLFPPVPNVVPRFNANAERSGTTVYIYHDNGDDLQESTTLFRINGVTVPKANITFLHGQGWPWSQGKTIRIDYPGAGTPETVEVDYNRGGTQVSVFSYRFGAPTPTPVVTGTVTVPATATSRPTGTVQPSGTVTPTITVTPLPSVTPYSGPPIAAFSGTPRQGGAPLTVQFTDQSAGKPEAWLWTFGDGTSSMVQNPIHAYAVSGVYTVSLTVSNSQGSNTRTETGYISAGQSPGAMFEAIPTEGPAPLAVQFRDLSTGSPASWAWDFGDGTGSKEQNPSHLYIAPGTYAVSLTVANGFGSNTRIQSSFIRVVSVPMKDINLIASSTGYIAPGGYLQFVASGPGSVKIGGSDFLLKDGDLVQLYPGDVSSGEISVNQLGIVQFAFSDVRMLVNGQPVRSGIVSAINVPSYAGLRSTLTLVIPPGDPNLLVYIDDARQATPNPHQITIAGIGTNDQGHMYLSYRLGEMVFRGGAAAVSSP